MEEGGCIADTVENSIELSCFGTRRAKEHEGGWILNHILPIYSSCLVTSIGLDMKVSVARNEIINHIFFCEYVLFVGLKARSF